jgi:hypothetical protein
MKVNRYPLAEDGVGCRSGGWGAAGYDAFIRRHGVQVNVGQIIVNQNLAPPDCVQKPEATLPDVVEVEELGTPVST